MSQEILDSNGEHRFLIRDDPSGHPRERTLLEDATYQIDQYEADEDLLEGGADEDVDARIVRVRKKFIAELARTPFEAAFDQCMWLRDHYELRQRHEQKQQLRKDTLKRDWELFIQPPVPTDPYLRNERGRVERVQWYDRSRDDGKAIDVSLLGEWSAEFNDLVDLYFGRATDMVFARAKEQSVESDADDEALSLQAAAMHGAGTKGRERSNTDFLDNVFSWNRMGSTHTTLQTADCLVGQLKRRDFANWSENGGRYISAILLQLQASNNDKYTECNRFLVDILTSLLATGLSASETKIGIETTAEVERRRAGNLAEQLHLLGLQQALADSGALDAIIAIISGARDLGMRTPYQQAIVPKVIELASEMMRYGPEPLQNQFIERLKASLSGYTSAKDFLPALKEQLLNSKKGCLSQIRRALEGSAASYSQASAQDEKKLLKLKAACDETTTLLTFLQMLCENHNHDAQTYLQQQRATRSIDVVSAVSDALHELCSTMSEHTKYVAEDDAVRQLLDDAPPTAAIGEAMMGLGAMKGIKLIAWYTYDTAAELNALGMQCTVAAQAFATLAEFVQGPCPRNQHVLAVQTSACEMVGPLLEFLLAIQISGKTSFGRRSTSKGAAGEWLSSRPIEMTERQKEYLSAAESNRAMTWLRKQGTGETRDEFEVQAEKLLHEARKMEIRMLMFLSGLLEGETDDDVIMAMIASLPPLTLISLLNLHWQTELKSKRARLMGATASRHTDDTAQDETELTFLYFSTLQLLTEDHIGGSGAERLRSIYRKWIKDDGRDIVRYARKIEIIDADGKLGRVYFQMPEFINLVWRSTVVEQHKRDLLFEVNRDSPEEKLKDFWLRIDNFIAVLKHQHQLRTLRHQGGIWIIVGSLVELITRAHRVFFYLSIVFAFLIQIVLLFPRIDSNVPDAVGNSTPSFRYEWGLLSADSNAYQGCLDGLSTTLIVMTSLELTAHMIGEVYLRITLEIKAVRQKGGVALKLKSGGLRVRSTTPRSPMLLKIRALILGEEVLWRISPFTYALCSLVTDWETLAFGGFLATAVLSLAHTPEWSCVNLLALARRVPEMRYVAQVMRTNLAQLLNTLALALMIIYIFSVFAWTSPIIQNDYAILDKAPGSLGEETRSMFLNSLFFWDYGFREAPVFTYTFALRNASSYTPASEGELDLTAGQVDRGEIFLGFVFNVLYHIVIILVFSAVVSGIIIDAFAEKRSTNNSIRNDILNTCFICNIEREDFEQLNLNFKQHVREEHNLWDYAFFRLYLESKDAIDYTGLETFCSSQIRDKKISWFPIKKAIKIEGRNKEKKDLPGLYRRLNTLEDHINGQVSQMRSMRQSQREQGGALKDVKDELSTVRKSVDEMKELLGAALNRLPAS